MIPPSPATRWQREHVAAKISLPRDASPAPLANGFPHNSTHSRGAVDPRHEAEDDIESEKRSRRQSSNLLAPPARQFNRAYLPPGEGFGFSFFGLRFSFCARWPFDMTASPMLHDPPRD